MINFYAWLSRVISILILTIGILLGYIIERKSSQNQERDVSATYQMRNESPLPVFQTENQEPNQRTVDGLEGEMFQ